MEGSTWKETRPAKWWPLTFLKLCFFLNSPSIKGIRCKNEWNWVEQSTLWTNNVKSDPKRISLQEAVETHIQKDMIHISRCAKRGMKFGGFCCIVFFFMTTHRSLWKPTGTVHVVHTSRSENLKKRQKIYRSLPRQLIYLCSLLGFETSGMYWWKCQAWFFTHLAAQKCICILHFQ